MSDVNIFSALLGGILTFLAPCTFPLIPAYIGFLAGGVTADAQLRLRIMRNALLFVLGFTLVFMSFGLLSGALGKFLVLHRLFLSQVGGAMVIVLGLLLLLRVPLPDLFGSSLLPSWITPGRPTSAFLLGLFFGLGWSPCIGPILGSILFLASTSGSVVIGASLLFVYSIGLAIPFLLVALLYGTAFTYVTALGKFLPFIERAAGIFLIILGSLLVFGKFGLFTVWLSVERLGDWYGQLMNFM